MHGAPCRGRWREGRAGRPCVPPAARASGPTRLSCPGALAGAPRPAAGFRTVSAPQVSKFAVTEFGPMRFYSLCICKPVTGGVSRSSCSPEEAGATLPRARGAVLWTPAVSHSEGPIFHRAPRPCRRLRPHSVCTPLSVRTRDVFSTHTSFLSCTISHRSRRPLEETSGSITEIFPGTTIISRVCVSKFMMSCAML